MWVLESTVSLSDPNISISGQGWAHRCFQARSLSDMVNFIFICSSDRKSSYSFSSLIITSITRYESNIALVLKRIAYLMRTRCLIWLWQPTSGSDWDGRGALQPFLVCWLVSLPFVEFLQNSGRTYVNPRATVPGLRHSFRLALQPRQPWRLPALLFSSCRLLCTADGDKEY